MRKIFSVFLAFSILFVNIIGGFNIFAESDPEEVVKLDKYVKRVKLEYKNNGNTYNEIDEKAILYRDTKLRFKLSYEIPEKTLGKESILEYQIPNVFKNVKEIKEQQIVDELGKTVGSYSVDKNGLVKINLIDEYIEKNNKDDAEILGTFFFETEVKEVEITEIKNNKIEFVEGVEIPWKDIDVKGDISLEKNKRYGPDVDGKITYTINIKSENGTFDKVILEDNVKGGKFCDTAQIYNKSTNESKTIPIENSDTLSIELDKMEPHTEYEIIYTIQKDDKAETVKNTAKATSKDMNGDEISSEDTVEVTLKNISKTGKIVEVNGEKKILWKINIKPTMENLEGAYLEDKFLNSIEITEATLDGNLVTLPYTFTKEAIESKIKENKDFEFLVYTDPLKDIGSVYSSNEAFLKKDGKQIDYDKGYVGVDYDQFDPVKKSAVGIEVIGDKKAEITWKVVINTKDGPIKKGTLLEDSFFANEQEFKDIEQLKIDLENSIRKSLKIDEKDIISITKENNKIYIKFLIDIPTGKEFEVTYKSIGNIKDENEKQEFGNSISIKDTPSKSEDKIFYKPIIKKEDSNDKGKKTTKHDYYDEDINGILKWLITIDLNAFKDKEEIAIVEELPSGIELLEKEGSTNVYVSIRNLDGSEYYAPLNLKKEEDKEGRLFKKDSYDILKMKVSYKKVEGKKKYKLILKLDKSVLSKVSEETEFDFEVTTKINDNVKYNMKNGLPTHRFTNKVSVLTDDKSVVDIEQTQEVTKDEEHNVISKQLNELKNNVLEYELLINPESKKLVDNAELELEDILTYKADKNYLATMEFVEGSLEIYKYNSETNEVGEQITGIQYNNIVNNNIDGNIFEGNSSIFMKVPDEIALYIKYKYKLNGKKGTVVRDIKNEAHLKGMKKEHSDIVSSSYRIVQDSSATAEIKVNYIDVYKVDSKYSSIALKGAKFIISRYDGNEFVKLDEIFETDENGKFRFSKNDFEKEFTLNTVFKIEEVQAPVGYVKKEEPEYFYLYEGSMNGYENVDVGIDVKQIKPIQTGSSYKFKNEKLVLPMTGGRISKSFVSGIVLIVFLGLKKL